MKTTRAQNLLAAPLICALAGFSAGLTCYVGTTRINYLKK